MKKHISFFSLSLLLIPTYFYAMEDNNLTNSQVLQFEKQNLEFEEQTPYYAPQTMSAPTQTLQNQVHQKVGSKRISSITQSTIYTRRKDMENSPTHEAKPWSVMGLLNTFRDATSIALNEVYYLKGKPDNITDIAHKLEWGINDTLRKIHDIRDTNKPAVTKLPEVKGTATEEELDQINQIQEENRCKAADSLLAILRQQQPHTENLRTIVIGAHENDICLNEDVLLKAHTHLKKARLEALQYQTHALKESQRYLQSDKNLRCDIYDIKLVKTDLDYPSEDEYDDASICQHYMNVASYDDMKYLEDTK